MTTLHFPLAPSHTALILNGERDAALAPQISDYQHFIIADGAWQAFQPLLKNYQGDTEPKITVIGDGDSIIHAPAYFIHRPDQDNTDFAKTLQHATDHGHQTLDVYWASGGEMDHFLGNLAVANQYAADIQLHFFNDKQSYRLLTEYQDANTTLTGVDERTISLFPFPEASVSSTGLQYPLHKLSLNQHQQQSLRNKATADTVTLSIQGRVWLFVSNS